MITLLIYITIFFKLAPIFLTLSFITPITVNTKEQIRANKHMGHIKIPPLYKKKMTAIAVKQVIYKTSKFRTYSPYSPFRASNYKVGKFLLMEVSYQSIQ